MFKTDSLLPFILYFNQTNTTTNIKLGRTGIRANKNQCGRGFKEGATGFSKVGGKILRILTRLGKMATPPKRRLFNSPTEDLDGNAVSGYIQDVSPIKISAKNYPYFQGIIQTDTDVYRKIVCFDVQKHGNLNQAHLSKTPVKLQRVNFAPNKEDASKSDILINQRSTINTGSLNFQFYQQPEKESGKTQGKKTVLAINNIPEKNSVSLLMRG